MRRLKLAVAIATKGRRREAGQLLAQLGRQSRQADRVVFAVSNRDDAPEGAEIVLAPPGLAAQRNAALARLTGVDIVVFFDDDFVPATGSLAAIERLFQDRPEIAGATGQVIADGVGGEVIAEAEALRLCADWTRSVAARSLRGLHDTQTQGPSERRVIGLYGCNMAIRMSAANGLRFDEALPLYGWQEDLDFGARLSARGLVIKSPSFFGVHRGVRSARPREVGLGYAQIANPAHLMKGRHIPRRYLLTLAARNVAANHLGLLTRRGGVDRLGRARGNWLALADLMRGALSPARAADL